MTLSKSQYIRGLQCHKSLWLLKHKPELRVFTNDKIDAQLEIGNQVGDLAKELFPNGVEIAFDSDNFDIMISKTKELIEAGEEVIYEATFREDGIFVMADILVKNGDAWDIYEVKSSTRLKEYHVNDTSVQWYALSKVLKLNRAFVIHIDNLYTREDALDIQELFMIEDVTEFVLDRQSDIKVQLLEMEGMLKKDIPDIDIGRHCSDPFGCDFSDHCWGHIPQENSVFDISYASGKQWELYKEGILSIDDIPNDFHFGTNASLQIAHHKSQEVKIDKEAIKEFLDTIEYPINFFDFETFQNAIPRFDNQRPYAQIPFQYSLHILHEDGRLEHKEFLADEHSDPRCTLSKQMLKDITSTGSIVAYSQSFEITQIRNLSYDCPKYDEALEALIDRFVDLAHPFQRKHYYHPNFKGKYSIKVVLPTLFPDNEELNYKKLGSIQNGSDAMETFANLHLLEDKTQVANIRKDLLAYCHLDTFAMVKIWEELHQIVEE